MKIKPQHEGQPEKITVSFPEDVYRDLVAYRELLGGKTKINYVIVEAVRGFLRHDQEFQQKRKAKAERAGTAHPGAAAAAGAR